MKQQIASIKAEFLKNRSANILWITFIAFALAPIMGGVLMWLMRSQGALSGPLAAKAEMMDFNANWNSYLGILTQAVGVGGVMVFGFVASWIFGREYSDGTAKDLMSLPISRVKILNAKFMVYVIWCFGLALSNLLIGIVIAVSLSIFTVDLSAFLLSLADYGITTILTIVIGTPLAFFAIYGKGFLAPLGIVALTLVFSQIIAAIGFGAYFPWAIPGLFSGAGGEFRNQLNLLSYSVLFITGIAGYVATTTYWKRADQTK